MFGHTTFFSNSTLGAVPPFSSLSNMTHLQSAPGIISVVYTFVGQLGVAEFSVLEAEVFPAEFNTGVSPVVIVFPSDLSAVALASDKDIHPATFFPTSTARSATLVMIVVSDTMLFMVSSTAVFEKV
jgi:hypothetical protein